MGVKISKIKQRLERKNIDQLKEYCVHNMKLKKADLIDLLEECGCCPNKKATYYDIVYDYKDIVIDIIIELWEQCD